MPLPHTFLKRSGLDDCKHIQYGDQISSLFDILHLTNSQSFKKNKTRKKELKQLIRMETPSPLHLKRIQFTLLIALKWFLTFRFLSDKKPEEFTLFIIYVTVMLIYVTVMLTFLLRSSRIHMWLKD